MRLSGVPAAERQGVRQTGAPSEAQIDHTGQAMTVNGNLATLLVFVAFGSCAERQAGDRRESSTAKKVSTPPDLFCDRDADCEISIKDKDLKRCRYLGVEPYAISRAAMKRLQARIELECPNEWNPVGYWRCGTVATDWIAVCDSHVCERRPAKVGSLPKSSCPEPSKPACVDISPGWCDPTYDPLSHP